MARPRLAALAGIAILAVSTAALLAATSLFQHLELKTYDAYLSRTSTGPDSRIALVVIDDKSRAAYPEPLLLWNRHYRDLLAALAGAGARVAGIDVYFSIPMDRWVAGEDAILSRGYMEAAATMPIVLGYPGVESREAAPVYMLAAATGHLGFLNLTQDRDDYIRRQQLYAPSADGRVYAFSVQLASVFLQIPPAELIERWETSLDRDRALRISYRGWRAFRAVPFADVVDAFRRNDQSFLREKFAGRAVLIGTDSFDDRHATPTSSARGERMNGVEIHAHALATLLDARPVRPVASWWRWLLVLASAALVCAAVLFRGPLAGALAAAAVFVVISVAGVLAMESARFLSPVPILAGVPLAFAGAVSYRAATEDRERRRLHRIFAQYVPDNVVEQILAGGAARFAGERALITVVFTDVRGFTTLSESMPPEALLEQLNEYFRAMTGVVLNNGGVVDKFLGDGLLALFGAPVRHEDHARRALDAARQMQEGLRFLNSRWAERGRPQFRVAIGLHTGEAVVGNLGSERKVEYTALGDTVNVASRVVTACKSVMKDACCGILLTEDTLRAIGPVADAEDIGEHQLKGRTIPLRLYRIGGC